MLKRVFFVNLLLLFSPDINAGQLQYASIAGLVEQEVGRLVIPQVYKKLDLDVLIIPMPAQQAQKNAGSGKVDGEILRIWSYGEENADLIRVPTPYYQLETMAFYKPERGIQILSRDDLVNYRLLKILGVKHTENITAGLHNVVDIDSTEKMMQLLEYGRADVALTNTIDGIVALARLDKANSIVHADKPLAVLSLYHYIHRRHQDLVAKVNGVLLEMKRTGELQILVERAENSVIHSVL